jgi:hypothetical protein
MLHLTAREVLDDCRLSVEMMEVESDHARLRVQWIGALALLRLVGDVLNKVDSKRGDHIAAAIRTQFEADKNCVVYREFIKGARDRAVHLYDHDLLDVSEIPILVEHSNGELEQFELDECLYMPLTGLFRPGDDARDVYRDAIKWWDQHIASIEQSIRQ